MGIRGKARKPFEVDIKPKKVTEADIAKVVTDYYNDGFEVYPEVPIGGGIIDIMVKDLNIITSIEVKKSFSFDVLEQAIRNKQYAHYSCIAVPAFQKQWFKRQLCRDYGIGLILVRMDNKYLNVELVQEAKFNRHVTLPKFEEWMKKSVSGSKNDRMTAFKNMIQEIETKVRRSGGVAEFEEVFDLAISTYSSIQSAKNTLRAHCRNGIVKEFKFEGSKIILNNKNR